MEENNKYFKFEKAIEEVINRHSIENNSNTPDFILADFLTNVLQAYDDAINKRSRFSNSLNEYNVNSTEIIQDDKILEFLKFAEPYYWGENAFSSYEQIYYDVYLKENKNNFIKQTFLSADKTIARNSEGVYFQIGETAIFKNKEVEIALFFVDVVDYTVNVKTINGEYLSLDELKKITSKHKF